MPDTLAVFNRIASTDERFVSFTLRLRKPLRLDYTVSGFLDQKKYLKPEIFEKKIELLLGVDSNFAFDMSGQIEYPNEFKGSRCNFMVNSLAGSDYIDYARQGLVGAGQYRNGEFEFHLYVAPDVAKNIIERRLLAEKVGVKGGVVEEIHDREFAEEQEWPAWMRLSVDAVNYRHRDPDDRAKDIVAFSLIRLCC